MRFPVLDTELPAASHHSLFVVIVPERHPTHVTVLRVAPHRTLRRRFTFGWAAFIHDVSVGTHGLYVGTNVIRRLTNQPDQLLRLDPRTLRLLASSQFPAAVAAVAAAGGLWATIQDGRVVRLDPRTLTVLASQQVALQTAEFNHSVTVSRPALGLGSVWVLVGNETRLDLLRLDPATLAVERRTRVPTRGRYAQAVGGVVADAKHVYLVGSTAATVSYAGRVTFWPRTVPRLGAIALHGSNLVAVTDPQHWLLELDRQGYIIRRMRIAGAGAPLTVTDDEAWLAANVGTGTGLVHVQLLRP